MYQIIRNHASIKGGTNNLKIVQILKNSKIIKSFSSLKKDYPKLEMIALRWCKNNQISGLKAPATKGLTTLCTKMVGVTGRRKKDGTQKKGYIATKGGKLVKKPTAKKVKM